jgi:hypothetical protein
MNYSSGIMDALGGKVLERFVASMFEEEGYRRLAFKHPESVLAEYRRLGKPVFSMQVTIPRIGSAGYGLCDLFITDSRHPDGAIIECKGQSTTGSVTEKTHSIANNSGAIPWDSYIIANSAYWAFARAWWNDEEERCGKKGSDYHHGHIKGAYTCSQFRESFFGRQT